MQKEAARFRAVWHRSVAVLGRSALTALIDLCLSHGGMGQALATRAIGCTMTQVSRLAVSFPLRVAKCHNIHRSKRG